MRCQETERSSVASGRFMTRRRTPVLSIALQAVISICMILTSSFEKLLLYIGFTLSLFSVLAVVGLFRLRVTRKITVRGYRTFGYPVTPLIFVGGNALIISLMLLNNPVTVFWGLFTIAIGTVFYWWAAKLRTFASSRTLVEGAER